MKNFLVFLLSIQSFFVFGCIYHLELASKPQTTPDTGHGGYFPGLEAFKDASPDLTNKGLAKGEILEVWGKLTSLSLRPYKNLQILIWQADAEGNYTQAEGNDSGFSYRGKAILTSDGSFYFRTVKPFPNGLGRSNIHVAVADDKKVLLFTEVHLKTESSQSGEPIIYPQNTLFTQLFPPSIRVFGYFYICPEITIP